MTYRIGIVGAGFLTRHSLVPALRGMPGGRLEEPAGAGLGLAIARGLVEAHRGRIDASNHGPGCRFEVRLPLVSAAAH